MARRPIPKRRLMDSMDFDRKLSAGFSETNVVTFDRKVKKTVSRAPESVELLRNGLFFRIARLSL
ncbi:hypothetical protein DWW79_11120 [Alistipes sp. AF17-16]|nr:hypothetical protein DW082_02340 [Alistipes sp. AF48-12]RHR61606.1 hypothetical protein DWW79_11120 [Alistipes sp. AF17-16]HAY31688.1 hypothetical protein [Alistipes sp.]